MKTSKRGLAEIAAHEGIVLSKYKDSVGVWTIGIGHTKNAGSPNPEDVVGELSLQDIMEIFARDIEKFEKRVTKAFSRALTQSQFDAAVSFDFNTGGIHRASWVRFFNAGEDERAQHTFMKWRKPREIIPRRQAECDLFFKGKYSSKGKVNVYSASAKGAVRWSSGRQVVLPSLTSKKDDKLPLLKETDAPERKVRKTEIIAQSIVVISTAITALAVAFSKKITSFFQSVR
jgi:lysozyme